MQFKITMVEDQCKFYEETIISNNLNEEKMNLNLFNLCSNIIVANFVNK